MKEIFCSAIAESHMSLSGMRLTGSALLRYACETEIRCLREEANPDEPYSGHSHPETGATEASSDPESKTE